MNKRVQFKMVCSHHNVSKQAPSQVIIGLLEHGGFSICVESMELTEVESLYELGIGLVIVGIIILVLAIVLIVVPHTKSKGKLKAAGAIIVGPVPIIFGTDKNSLKTLLALSIGLTLLLIVAMLVYYFLLR
jgi:uncharacterized membrane protein